MRGVGLDLKRRPRFMAQGSRQGDIKALGGVASCGLRRGFIEPVYEAYLFYLIQFSLLGCWSRLWGVGECFIRIKNFLIDNELCLNRLLPAIV